MTDAKFALEMCRASLEMVLECRFQARRVAGVHGDSGCPVGARDNLGFRALTTQYHHLRRQEQAVRRYVPVPMSFVRSFHSERVALMALTQRLLARRNTSYLT